MAYPYRTIPSLSAREIRRFRSKLKIKGENDCWLWKKKFTRAGYGQIYIKGFLFAAHRIAYFLHYGKDPGNLLVCHNCPGKDNPRCCNPKHLWLGTQQDNRVDCIVKGNQVRGERHGSSKLTEPQVLEIRSLYSEGDISLKRIAVAFGVTSSTVRDIIHRNHWKHI